MSYESFQVPPIDSTVDEVMSIESHWEVGTFEASLFGFARYKRLTPYLHDILHVTAIRGLY